VGDYNSNKLFTKALSALIPLQFTVKGCGKSSRAAASLSLSFDALVPLCIYIYIYAERHKCSADDFFHMHL
jgi:hypothetical protein